MSRPLTSAARVAAVAIAVLLGAPGVAHADAAGPTDYRTEITSITPATDAVEVTIEGGDSFVRVDVVPGHEVVVLGYDAEPYLLVAGDGTVSHNLRSLATYYNEDRYGNDDNPAIVDPEAPPLWEQIGGGGSWAWHDHRAHWMGGEPPVNMEPGDSFPVQVVPIVVDGTAVEIGVRTTLLPGPSWWPVAFGLLVGLSLVMFTTLSGPATVTLGALLLSGAALVVGVAQYRSLPAETGPLLTWWVLPAISLACAIATVLLYGRSVLVQHALVGLAGAQLLVWAFARRSGLSKAVLPTDLGFGFDRFVTAAALTGGAALLVVAVRALLFPPPSPTVSPTVNPTN